MTNTTIVALLVLLTSCAGTNRPLNLTFDKRLEQQGIAAPVLVASVSGTKVLFIINTAASAPTLAPWVAENMAGLKEVTVQKDRHEKIKLELVRAPLRYDGVNYGEHDFYVSHLPSSYRALGIGGVLPPQLLAPVGQAVVIDFKKSEIRQGQFRELVLETSSTQLTGDTYKVCQGEVSLYATDVKVNGKDMRMLLDSSLERSLISDESTVGKQLLGTRKAAPAPGKSVRFRGVHFELAGGSHHLGASVRKLPSKVCGEDGRLGMDYLRRCMIFMEGQKFALDCR
jgi:hypothetical protein